MSHSLPTRISVLGGITALLVAGTVPVSAEAAPRVHTSGYQQAWAEWRRGAHAVDADRGRYRHRAKVDLKAAPGDGCYAQCHELYELYSAPDAMLTPAQMRRVRHAVRHLDRFFHTPGLYT